MENKPNFLDLINGSTPVLVDFWADWCQPCHMLAPTVQRLAEANKGRMTVIKINVDKAPKVARHYGIQGIPALLLFHAGQVVWRGVGVQPFDTLQAEISAKLPQQ